MADNDDVPRSAETPRRDLLSSPRSSDAAIMSDVRRRRFLHVRHPIMSPLPHAEVASLTSKDIQLAVRR